MNSSFGEKVRFALGLFTRATDLERAVEELGAAGLPLRQVKVIAPPQGSGEGSGSDPDAWSSRGPLLGVDTWVVSEATSGHCPWSFAPAYLAHASGGAAPAKREVMPDFHIWAMERHAQQLDRHLRRGGGIAVVEVRTEAEERAVYSTLLRHATAGVQTHDISRS